MLSFRGQTKAIAISTSVNLEPESGLLYETSSLGHFSQQYAKFE